MNHLHFYNRKMQFSEIVPTTDGLLPYLNSLFADSKEEAKELVHVQGGEDPYPDCHRFGFERA